MSSSVARRLIISALFLASFAAILLCIAFAHQTLPVYVVERTGNRIAESSAVDVAEAEKIDINKASKEQLETLPGIGKVIAGRIIEYREEHGGFYDVGELREVEGIGNKQLENLLPYIYT